MLPYAAMCPQEKVGDPVPATVVYVTSLPKGKLIKLASHGSKNGNVTQS